MEFTTPNIRAQYEGPFTEMLLPLKQPQGTDIPSVSNKEDQMKETGRSDTNGQGKTFRLSSLLKILDTVFILSLIHI